MTSENGGKVFIGPNSQLSTELRKTYSPIVAASLLGRGSGFFFNCNEQALVCNLTLGTDTTMKDNRVLDKSSNSYVDAEKDRAIYYTGDNPPSEPESLKYQTQQYFPPQVNGNDIILIDGDNWSTFQTEYLKESGRINWDGMNSANDYIQTDTFPKMPTYVTSANLGSNAIFSAFKPLDFTKFAAANGDMTNIAAASTFPDSAMANGQYYSYIGIVDNSQTSSNANRYRFQASDNVT